VVILGVTGRNFAAGMSGGVAYVLDLDGQFASRCNMEMIELSTLAELGDVRASESVHALVEEHFEMTGSEVARRLLDDWKAAEKQLVRVMPLEYKRVLQERADQAAADAALAMQKEVA
jgi:glutamate synthase domain-containing protein 3